MRDAEAAFSRAVELNPDLAEAWAGLGFVRMARGKVEEGFEHCRRATRLRSDLGAPHRHRAAAFLAHGHLEEAAKAAAEARRLEPQAVESLVTMAAVWLQCGLRDAARRLIERAVREHPESAEAYVTRAAVLATEGDLEAAGRDLASGLARNPRLAPAHAALSQLRRRQGRRSEALAAIVEARAIHPDAEDYVLQHIDLLEENGDRGAAIGLAHEFLRVQPRSRTPRLRLAMLLLDTGDLDGALRHIPAVLPNSSASAAWLGLAHNWQVLRGEPLRRRCLERSIEAGGDHVVQLLLAQSLLSLGEPARALEIVDSVKEQVAAFVLRAEILDRLERPDEAREALEAGARAAPEDALTAMRLGILYRRGMDFERAEASLRRAAELAPSEPVAQEQLAILLSETQRFTEAEAALRRGLELGPDNRSLRFNLGVLLARSKRWPEAERLLREAVAVSPLNVNALGNLGRVLAEQQRHEEAADAFLQAIELVPRDAGARHGLLAALGNLRRFDEALRAARAWADDYPDDPQAWRSVALAMSTLGDPGAMAAAERVAALAPDSLTSYETFGIVSLGLGRPAEAVMWFDKGLAKEPRAASLLVNRALAVEDVEGLDAVAAELERALEIEPEGHAVQMNLSMVRLRLGRFAEGWKGYETRTTALRGPKSLVDMKIASGARPDLSGSSVLVRAEQGLGDTIHFMRYVKRIAAEAREVAFHVQDQLAWMMWGVAPNVRISGYRDPIPATDYQVSLISLPGYYDADLASVPGETPYLTADPARVATWRAHLGDDGFKVGIVWHTNPAHGNTKRWIPLSLLAPLARIEGVRLISLQKEFGVDQLEGLPEGVRIETLGGAYDEGPDAFVDTAAIVTHLDLVITIDTSTCHLAGALGRPVWVLLPKSSDWRWLTDRADSPWYPTLRLFQQRVSGDWTGVAQDVARRLARVAAGEAPAVWPV